MWDSNRNGLELCDSFMVVEMTFNKMKFQYIIEIYLFIYHTLILLFGDIYAINTEKLRMNEKMSSEVKVRKDSR